MKTLILLAFLFSGLAYGETCQIKTKQDISEGLAGLDSFIQQAMLETGTTAVSLAIIAEGGIFSRRYYGNGVTEHTAFQAGSISKVASAFGSLKMFETRGIGMNLPLSQWVESPYPAPSPYVNEISLKTVLNHTSGMGNRFGDRTIYFRPGTKYSYSGQAFSYLQQVVERMTNRSYDRWMEDGIIPSLGMRESTFHFDLSGSPVVLAQASLVSPPSDIAQLLIELIHPRMENRDVVAEMTHPSIEVIPHRLAWGLGIGIYSCDGDRAFWHWGSNHTQAGSFDSLAIVYERSKTGIVIMAEGPRGQTLLKKAVEKAIGGPDFGYWSDVPTLF